ncbi:unnamed protein product [Amoebophrya sp. A120]|nr:unnamed protein product [Amoebophrya sp. A120]|eukprot:GSA120T00001506001.1
MMDNLLCTRPRPPSGVFSEMSGGPPLSTTHQAKQLGVASATSENENYSAGAEPYPNHLGEVFFDLTRNTGAARLRKNFRSNPLMMEEDYVRNPVRSELQPTPGVLKTNVLSENEQAVLKSYNFSAEILKMRRDKELEQQQANGDGNNPDAKGQFVVSHQHHAAGPTPSEVEQDHPPKFKTAAELRRDARESRMLHEQHANSIALRSLHQRGLSSFNASALSFTNGGAGSTSGGSTNAKSSGAATGPSMSAGTRVVAPAAELGHERLVTWSSEHMRGGTRKRNKTMRVDPAILQALSKTGPPPSSDSSCELPTSFLQQDHIMPGVRHVLDHGGVSSSTSSNGWSSGPVTTAAPAPTPAPLDQFNNTFFGNLNLPAARAGSVSHDPVSLAAKILGEAPAPRIQNSTRAKTRTASFDLESTAGSDFSRSFRTNVNQVKLPPLPTRLETPAHVLVN